MRPVTDLTRYRMVRQHPMTNWFRWHEAFQELTLSLLRIQFHAHRDFLRCFLR